MNTVKKIGNVAVVLAILTFVIFVITDCIRALV